MQSNLMRMNSGLNVDVFDLKTMDINIPDIAHHLSLQCRFIGACKHPYSVAQHSIYVALRVFLLTRDDNLARKALLHDGSEAYLGDVARPIKVTPMFELYRNVEEQIQRRVWLRFGLSPDGNELIEQVDNELLAIECETLFSPPLIPQTSSNVPPAHEVNWTVKIPAWDWHVARKTFITVFKDPSALDSYAAHITPRRIRA
jgi:uncharacterized protein